MWPFLQGRRGYAGVFSRRVMRGEGEGAKPLCSVASAEVCAAFRTYLVEGADPLLAGIRLEVLQHHLLDHQPRALRRGHDSHLLVDRHGRGRPDRARAAFTDADVPGLSSSKLLSGEFKSGAAMMKPSKHAMGATGML